MPSDEITDLPVVRTQIPQTPPPIATSIIANEQAGKKEPEKRSVSPSGEVSVVPLNEKAEAMNQEKANDAATEEAVVPFADKGKVHCGI